MRTEAEMMAEINKKRKLMIETAKEKGFSNTETVRYSQELDQLILEYQYNRMMKEQEDPLCLPKVTLVMPKSYMTI